MRRLLRVLCVVLGLAGLCSLPTYVGAEDAKPTRAHRHRSKRMKKADARAEPSEALPAAEERSAKPRAESRAERRKKKHGRDRVVAERTENAPAAKHEAGPSAGAQAAQAAQAAASGVNQQIVKEGDTSVKVMEFTGLGIDGRLKSPQLVYFVQRVRAEFERPELPHRSFMPELESSTGREPVR